MSGLTDLNLGSMSGLTDLNLGSISELLADVRQITLSVKSNNRTHFILLLRGSNEIIHIEPLELCPAQMLSVTF